jgi:hypothetical protein
VADGMALVAGRCGAHSARIGRQDRQHGDQENAKVRRLSYERIHDTPPAQSGPKASKPAQPATPLPPLLTLGRK